MGDIRSKCDLIAAIASIGAIIALAGSIIAYTDYPEVFSVINIVPFAVALVAALFAIRPKSTEILRFLNELLAGIMLFMSIVSYFVLVRYLSNMIEVSGFADITIGIWLMMAGSVIHLIFMIADDKAHKKVEADA